MAEEKKLVKKFVGTDRIYVSVANFALRMNAKPVVAKWQVETYAEKEGFKKGEDFREAMSTIFISPGMVIWLAGKCEKKSPADLMAVAELIGDIYSEELREQAEKAQESAGKTAQVEYAATVLGTLTRELGALVKASSNAEKRLRGDAEEPGKQSPALRDQANAADKSASPKSLFLENSKLLPPLSEEERNWLDQAYKACETFAKDANVPPAKVYRFVYRAMESRHHVDFEAQRAALMGKINLPADTPIKKIRLVACVKELRDAFDETITSPEGFVK